MPQNISFSHEQLGRMFPFFMILDKFLNILTISNDILKRSDLNEKVNLLNVFFIDIKKIPHENITAELLLEHTDTRVELVLKTVPENVYQGKFEYHDATGGFLFYGEPKSNPDDLPDKNDADPETSANDFYKRILDQVPADISVLNPDRSYVYLNEFTVLDPDIRNWMTGKLDEHFCAFLNIPMHIAASRAQLFDKVMKTMQPQFIIENYIHNHKTVYNKRSLLPLPGHDGEIKFVLSFSADITDQILTEHKLTESEKNYQDIYTYSPALIYSHDMEGRLISCNPAIKDILGYTEEEVLKMNIRDLLPPYDQKNISERYFDQLLSQKSSRGVFRIIPKNGNEVLYFHYQNYIAGENDVNPYVIGFSQDITERIKAEKELRSAKLVSEKLSKQKEIFLANMSHEIRTPINGILGLNNLLLKTHLNEQQEGYIRLSTESINNALFILNDILDIEKIGYGNVEFEKSDFNVSDKVLRTLQLFEHKANEKGVTIVFDDQLESGFIVKGDEYRLIQIVSNLISNAVKFTKQGSIHAGLEALKQNDHNVILKFSIRDTGIGITESALKKIFKPFVQASLTTTRKYGGSGLGLSISKKLIEMQGGTITVKSKPGEGTEFVFTLPYERVYGHEVNEKEVKQISYTGLKGKKMLVGEDVELNQFLIKGLLESWGCEVDVVDNGLQILNSIRSKNYDVILMDIQMPEMDGLSAARYIRDMDDASKANIPILAFTASVMQNDIKSYKNVKMNDYILKPYSEQVLYDKLLAVLGLGMPEPDVTLNIVNIMEDTPPALAALYDLEVIKFVSKDDDEVFDKMMKLLISTLSDQVVNINQLAARDDWEQVSQGVHKVKSSLLHIRADHLKPLIDKLEKNHGNYTKQEMDDLAAGFCTSLTAIVDALKADLLVHNK